MSSKDIFLGGSRVRLVFVHGREQQGKDPGELCQTWIDSLNAGMLAAGLPSLSGVDVALAYYGDALSELVDKWQSRKLSDVKLKGKEPNDIVDRTQLEILRELVGEDVTVVEGQVRSKGLQNSKLALALARIADDSRFAGDILARFTTDVALYLSVDQVARLVDDIVREVVGAQPCVVVGHSLGSVVAYRVLCDMGASAKVQKLVTVGSPLGLQSIRDRLIPPALQHPAGVASWFNAYDTRDLVSLYALDSKTWPITPEITNLASVDNGTSNRHGIIGYLNNADVARAIYDGLNAA